MAVLPGSLACRGVDSSGKDFATPQGTAVVGEPPDPMDIIEEILIEAKWFLAEPVMLFSASTSTFKILSTQVFNSMTAETLLKLS